MLQSSRVVVAISMAFLALAVIRRWPYGFYTFLRIVVCATAMWWALQAYQSRKPILIWTLGAIAVLFNPIIPIYMRRSQWHWFDLLAFLVFAISALVVRQKPDERSHTSQRVGY